MPAQIDPNKAHLVRVHGEVTAIYSWLNDERVMFLCATHRAGTPDTAGAPVYVIPEKNASAYDDPVQLLHTGKAAANALGLLESTAWVKIATIIHEGLPDLIRMPAAPGADYLAGSFGRMVLRADGQDMAERDLKLTKQGTTYA